MELVEAKEDHYQMGAKGFDNLDAFFIRLTKHLWSTGEKNVLDSGFCAVKPLTQLATRGAFRSVLIEKRRHCPKDGSGEVIKAHFEDSVVSHTDCFRMNLYGDNSKLDIHAFKELDYITVLMVMYGIMGRVGQEQSWT